jgi:hypothetical protein
LVDEDLDAVGTSPRLLATTAADEEGEDAVVGHAARLRRCRLLLRSFDVFLLG